MQQTIILQTVIPPLAVFRLKQQIQIMQPIVRPLVFRLEYQIHQVAKQQCSIYQVANINLTFIWHAPKGVKFLFFTSPTANSYTANCYTVGTPVRVPNSNQAANCYTVGTPIRVPGRYQVAKQQCSINQVANIPSYVYWFLILILSIGFLPGR